MKPRGYNIYIPYNKTLPRPTCVTIITSLPLSSNMGDSIVDTVAKLMEMGHDPFADFEGFDNVNSLCEAGESGSTDSILGKRKEPAYTPGPIDEDIAAAIAAAAESAAHSTMMAAAASGTVVAPPPMVQDLVFQPDISVFENIETMQPPRPEVKKARKSNKCSYDADNLITFGTFDKKKIPRSSNRRLLQVIHGLIDSEMRQIFDSDTNMLNSFYSDLNSDMKLVSNKRRVVLVDSMCIRIPQKSLKSVLMSGKYNKIVQYVKQSSETEFTALEVNSLLCHYSKAVRFEKDFPRFKQEKIGSMVVLCLNK